jgi:anaerobic magnesium-protoporphyrin IX monomethyl ester cyclase
MNSAKVVFVRPPNLQKSGQWKKQGVIRCPLNIALLASFVRERGDYDCVLVDFETTQISSVTDMAEIVLAACPKYVCITTLTPRFPAVARMAQEVKRLDPAVTIIVGGPHVTGSPQTALFDGISYGIIGEGEEALLELLDTLEAGRGPSSVENLIYRDGTGTKINGMRPFVKNLDEMPFPAWDLMNLDDYVDPVYFKGRHLAIFSGRGCPYDCTFCASRVTWRRKLRLRSTENVMDEIRHIVNVLGVQNLMFWDDTFAADKKRAMAICNRIIEEDLDISYTVQIRADAFSDELIEALRDSGCAFAAIGVESGNEQILKNIGKRETKEQFRDAVSAMKRANLPVIASYIIGLPGDTHETIKETMEFALELDADQSKFMILAPYPGTRVYDIAVEEGLADPTSFEQMEDLNYYDSVAINLSEVSDEDLIRYQDQAYEQYDAVHAN